VFDNTEGRTVQSVSEDGQGGVWIGFNGGPNAIQYWKEGAPKNFQASDNVLVKSVLADGRQTWVGTWTSWVGSWGESSDTVASDHRPVQVGRESPAAGLFGNQ
jgi:hypothetical protein